MSLEDIVCHLILRTLLLVSRRDIFLKSDTLNFFLRFCNTWSHTHTHTHTLTLSHTHTHSHIHTHTLHTHSMSVTESQSSCNGCHCSLFTSCFVFSAILNQPEEKGLVSIVSKRTIGRELATLAQKAPHLSSSLSNGRKSAVPSYS